MAAVDQLVSLLQILDCDVLSGNAERTRALMAAPTRSPEDSRARRVRKVIDDDTARHRPDDQLQIGAAINVGDGRGRQGTVPGLADGRRGKVDPIQLLTEIV